MKIQREWEHFPTGKTVDVLQSERTCYVGESMCTEGKSEWFPQREVMQSASQLSFNIK